MKRLSQFCVFFFVVSALYAQSAVNTLPQLDASLKTLAADINKKLTDQKAGKVGLYQWASGDSVPALGVYWAAQLTEELTNIPERSFILLRGGPAAADWTISGEIIEAAGVIRVYTRLFRSATNSIEASLHADFERTEHLAAMLAAGGPGRGSSAAARDAYETDSWENPYVVEIASGDGGPLTSRTLHSENDEDFFLLAPDKDGLLTLETTGNTDTCMELYEAASQNKLDDNDDGGSGDNARIRYSVRAGVRYIAKVKGYDGETGNYGFRAYLSEPVRAEPDEYEADDDFASAKEIQTGAPQQHTFTTGDDVDWVKFQVSQAGRYVIRARGRDSNRLDTSIELYDADHKSIDADDDGGEEFDARISARLQPGLYYLKVECLDRIPRQPYIISVTAE
jgi:hypothetical protein